MVEFISLINFKEGRKMNKSIDIPIYYIQDNAVHLIEVCPLLDLAKVIYLDTGQVSFIDTSYLKNNPENYKYIQVDILE